MKKDERKIIRQSVKALRKIGKLMSDDAQQHEGERAKAWREAAGLSRRRLAELTGYGQSTIAAIERGQWARGTEVDASTMQAYRLACAAVALGVQFEWGEIELRTLRVRIKVLIEPEADEA